MPSSIVTVANTTRNTVLGDRIVVAETTLSRIVGLLGKRGLEPGSGLLIYPSQSIHTVAMRFPIDVVFVDRKWRVTYLRPKMVPYRMTGIHWKSRCVIELPSGIIAKTSTRIGDQLSVTEQVDTAPVEDRVQ
jgi:uncharacterized membrane protein (UPF0127 family)